MKVNSRLGFLGALAATSIVAGTLALLTSIPSVPDALSCRRDNSCLSQALANGVRFFQASTLRTGYEQISIIAAFSLLFAVIWFYRRDLLSVPAVVGPFILAMWFAGITVGFSGTFTSYETSCSCDFIGTAVLEGAETAALVTLLVLAWRFWRRTKFDVSLKLSGRASNVLFAAGLGLVSIWVIYALFQVLRFSVVLYLLSNDSFLRPLEVFVAGTIKSQALQQSLGYGELAGLSFASAFILFTLAGLKGKTLRGSASRALLFFSALAYLYFLSVLAFDTNEVGLHILDVFKTFKVGTVWPLNNILGIGVTAFLILVLPLSLRGDSRPGTGPSSGVPVLALDASESKQDG